MQSLPEKGETADWWFAPFRLNPANQRLWREQEAVALRPKVFAVLSYLVEQQGQLVDKNRLLDAVWGHRHVSESVLEGCVSELRKALGDDAKAPRYLETVPRRGYRFVAEVKAFPAQKDPSSEESCSDPSLHTALLSPADADHWVGRQDLLRRLQGLWREAQRGERRMAFLSGEAGLGKTTLIEMFLHTPAVDGQALLWGQCIEHFGAGEAFLPLLGALQEWGSGVVATLRAQAPAWLAQLPGLLTAIDRTGLQRELLGATRERMLREGCELLEALSAEMPLIVVLEDLHWSDYATVDLLAALGRRRGRAALLVIGSYRASDVARREHPLRAVQQELQTHRLCTELPLDALSLAELRAYLAQRFRGQFPEDIARIVHRRTGGHPLFLVNLIDYLLAEGKLRQSGGWWSIAGGGDWLDRGVPKTTQALIEHQITRLSDDERRLLEAASASGTESSAALLAAVLDLDPLSVEARCECLARQGPMLVSAGMAEWPDGSVAGNYAFRHALYADVLYQRLTPASRVGLHRRLGERLEAAYGDRSADIAAKLARHFEEGRVWVKGVDYLRLAAEQETRRFANRESLGYLVRALALVERLPVEHRVESHLALLQQRALVHRALNAWSAVVADLEALIALAYVEHRREDEVSSLIALSFTLFLTNQPRCVAVVEQAVQRSPEVGGDGRLKVYAQALRAFFHLEFDRWQDEDRSAIVAAVAVARQIGDDEALAFHCEVQATLDNVQADYRGALGAAREAAQLGLAMGDGFHHLSGQCMSSWALLSLGRWGELRKVLSEAGRAAEQNASTLARTMFRLLDAYLHLEALDFRGTHGLCERLPLRSNGSSAMPLHQALLGHAYLGLGQPGEAARCFKALGETLESGAFIERRCRLMLQHGLGLYWLAQRDFALARTNTERLLELAVPPGDTFNSALGYRLLARIAVAKQDWSEAETQVLRALVAIDGKEMPLAAWRVYETAAQLHARRGKAERAQEFRGKAVAILTGLADSLDRTDPLRESLLAHPLLQDQIPHRQSGKRSNPLP